MGNWAGASHTTKWVRAQVQPCMLGKGNIDGPTLAQDPPHPMTVGRTRSCLGQTGRRTRPRWSLGCPPGPPAGRSATHGGQAGRLAARPQPLAAIHQQQPGIMRRLRPQSGRTEPAYRVRSLHSRELPLAFCFLLSLFHPRIVLGGFPNLFSLACAAPRACADINGCSSSSNNKAQNSHVWQPRGLRSRVSVHKAAHTPD